MSYSWHTECVTPSNYSGAFGGTTTAIVVAILAAIFYPPALTLVAIFGIIGYCQWWLYHRLVCLGGNQCIIGMPLGVYGQASQVGFLSKFDTDYSADILLAPSLLTDSIQDVAQKNTVQGHMIQDQRFWNNPANPLAGDLVTMYKNYSNLSFTGENESPADLVGAAGQIDQDNVNIGGQGILSPQQGASLGLIAPGSLNAQGLVVPIEWMAKTWHNPFDWILDSNGNLQQCTASSQGWSGASEPGWTGLVSITAWSAVTAFHFTFTAANQNAVGDVIVLSGFRNSLFFNNQTATVTAASATQFTATVTPLFVGSDTVGSEVQQSGGTVTESGSGVTLGALTKDNQIQWSCQGPPPAGPGIFEIEFEGSGVWDLYQAALVAAVPAGIAAAICWIPIIGWIVYLILSLVAIAILAIGALIAQTLSSPDVTVSGSAIHPGQDVLFVMGRWVLDSAHSGWNELHPVLSAQKLDPVDPANVLTGDPWTGSYYADPVKLQNKLDAMCGLTIEASAVLTVASQALPQNQWSIHPLVDGCSPEAPVPNLQ